MAGFPPIHCLVAAEQLQAVDGDQKGDGNVHVQDGRGHPLGVPEDDGVEEAHEERGKLDDPEEPEPDGDPAPPLDQGAVHDDLQVHAEAWLHAIQLPPRLPRQVPSIAAHLRVRLTAVAGRPVGIIEVVSASIPESLEVSYESLSGHRQTVPPLRDLLHEVAHDLRVAHLLLALGPLAQVCARALRQEVREHLLVHWLGVRAELPPLLLHAVSDDVEAVLVVVEAAAGVGPP
mmetsp:Transcript_102324/g.305546  ORF Transcript_102324/g.305546 Transcript_102324/m.305546 type:complete len:232 (-) Transcript_102324:1244-1939(-)